MRIMPCDIRRCGYCVKGVKAFIEQHGFNWNDFKRNGIDAEELRKTNDGMALKIIEAVENAK